MIKLYCLTIFDKQNYKITLFLFVKKQFKLLLFYICFVSIVVQLKKNSNLFYWIQDLLKSLINNYYTIINNVFNICKEWTTNRGTKLTEASQI